MSKVKSKKKKILIIVTASILSLILCAGIGAFVWYENSPFPTVVKMMSAVKDKDVETVLECIEPDMTNKIQLVMGFTGMSAEDLFDKILASETDKESEENDTPTEKSSIKFAGYERNGDNASISLETINGGETTTRELNFVRISGTWYLTLG